jgi:hypothetical protein
MTNTVTKTTYAEAVKWLHNSIILCNNITEIDPLIDYNFRFDQYDEENDSYIDIYQYFITDCSQSDVEYLEKYFDLKFSYSNLLDKYILCVDHCGTSWDYVACQVNNVDEFTPNVRSYKELTGYDY